VSGTVIVFHDVTERRRVEQACTMRDIRKDRLKSATGTYEIDCRLLRPDGSMRWITARGKRQCDVHGTPTHLPGVVIDITDRKRAEEATRESAARLQLALTAASLTEWSWDAGTDLATLSSSAAEMFDMPPGTLTWSQMQERVR
jgi:PAS domain-containing protein